MKLPIIFQRIEGLVLFLAAFYLYINRDGSWWLFIAWFLAIDTSMIGYLVNSRLGAYTYNLGHTLVTPILLYIVARYLDSSTLTLLSAIWFAHIGLDRALGFGLKQTSGFKHTHLGTLGK